MAKPAPSLLDHAVAALANIHAVEVGLASAHMDPKILQTIQQCASIFTQVVHALGAGGPVGAGGAPQSDAPTDAGPPPGPPAGGPPTGPPTGPPVEPASAPAGGPPPAQVHHTMQSAAHTLLAKHAAAQAEQK